MDPSGRAPDGLRPSENRTLKITVLSRFDPRTAEGTRSLALLLMLLSFAIASFMGEVINRDGILYIHTARAFLDGGLQAAMAIYNWPFYSMLIGGLSGATGLSLESAAHAVNLLLMLVLAHAFIRLDQTLSPGAARPWVALLVLMSFPALDHRLEIYRDWGFIAFGLLATVSLTRYWLADHGRIRDALIWQAAMTMAMLFRVEAVALLALAPVALLCQGRPPMARLQRFATTSLLSLIASIAVIVATGAGLIPAGKLEDVARYLDPEQLFHDFDRIARIMADQALPKHGEDWAGYFLFGGVLLMSVWTTFGTVGPFLTTVGGVGVVHGRLPRDRGWPLIYWLIVILLLVLVVFITARFIIVGRYALLTGLLIMMVVTAMIRRMLDAQTVSRTGRSARILLMAGLLIGTLGNVAALPDYKHYIRDSGHWVAGHIPPASTVLSNEPIMAYYAAREPGERLDNMDKLKAALVSTPAPFYVAVKIKHNEAGRAMRALFTHAPLATFESRRAHEAMEIYQIADKRADLNLTSAAPAALPNDTPHAHPAAH